MQYWWAPTSRAPTFGGAVLTNADLTNADLRNAVLRGADLFDADLTDADLTNADLTDADLFDAVLRRANVYGVRNPPGGFLSNAVHKLGAVCFEDPGEWISWRDDLEEPPAYPEDEIELAKVCGLRVP